MVIGAREAEWGSEICRRLQILATSSTKNNRGSNPEPLLKLQKLFGVYRMPLTKGTTCLLAGASQGQRLRAISSRVGKSNGGDTSAHSLGREGD